MRRLPLVVLALLLASCADGGPTLHPVRGQLLFNDQPAEGATVVFHPTDPAAPKPSGTVAADGSFTLSTYPRGAGAAAGDYVVVATWYPPNARQSNDPSNKLPPLYAGADTSPLRATVKPGGNDLEPFRLTR